MKKDFNIFVEGIADVRFFKQYISHLFGETIADERLVILKGWDNLKTEASALRMRSMSANGGVNLVIVDADKDYQTRKNEIAQWMMFLDNPNSKEVYEIMDKNENIKNARNELKQVSGDYELRRIAEGVN